MSDDRERFLSITASVNQAMVVVTASHRGNRSGCLVGFHGQVSIEPLRWGVWISRVNHSFPIVTEADTVAVHFLTSTQHHLAEHFGGLSGDEVDKFAGRRLADRADGIPVLAEVEHRIVGRRSAVYDGATDHACVIIAPTEFHGNGTFRPLRLDAVNDVTPGHPLH